MSAFCFLFILICYFAVTRFYNTLLLLYKCPDMVVYLFHQPFRSGSCPAHANRLHVLEQRSIYLLFIIYQM